MEKTENAKWNTIFRSVYARRQYGCIHVTKATRRVNTSEKQSKEEARTRAVCPARPLSYT